MGERLREWFVPPRTGRPADTLRWVRRHNLSTVALGLLFAAMLRAEGESWWWVGLLSAGFGLIGWFTMGPAIRRVEGQPPPDPATAPERRRRARRVTAVMYGATIVVAGVIIYVVDSLGAAIFVVAFSSVAAAFGFWLLRRWQPL